MERHIPLLTVSRGLFESSNFEWGVLSVRDFGIPNEEVLRTSRSEPFFACADRHHALHQSFD